MELANTEQTFDVHAPERAVFVTDDNRRARRLRRGTFVAASLACLWLVGLGVGMFGFGGLPGISLGKHNHHGAGRAQPKPNPARLSPIAGALAPGQSRQLVADRARQSQHRLGSQSRSARAPARPASPVTPPASAQQPANPAQRQRGWARKANPAPPGQVRIAQPKAPAGSRGQRRGQTTTTTTTTTTTPLPPGQAKKAPPPIPPPSEG
ncbi:MAG TPA: hypothetical protein VK488_15765 [Gaiellaceae bacterium]|nr:hypothetical protein [Gaiellaceae bacterium]